MVLSGLRSMVFAPRRESIDETSANPDPQGRRESMSLASNRSSLKDFLASIATMTGDLSNITAPPFVLDTKSVVEIPAFWAENPAVFCAPAEADEPAERALLVLKSFLAGMKSQCYMGHTEAEGVKKPLNAFLGELFLAHWEDEENGRTQIVSEQVSHHPPITACRVWNSKYGVVAEGYNRQKVTFNWTSMSVGVSSTGFALKSLEKHNEHYLLPLPDFKVKGVLSGAPYPETSGTSYIPSTSGYTSMIQFSGGKSFFGSGKKHGFTASLYHESDGPEQPLYTISGCWNDTFVIHDERTHTDIETINVPHMLQNLPTLHVAPLEEQDPWETRRAWHETITAINAGSMKAVTDAKSDIEQGQREMRRDEQRAGDVWSQVFYKNASEHTVVRELMDKIPDSDFDKTREATNGIWLFNPDAWEQRKAPYHPDLNPNNRREGEPRDRRRGSTDSARSARSSFSHSRVSSLATGTNTGTRSTMTTPRDSDELARPADKRPGSAVATPARASPKASPPSSLRSSHSPDASSTNIATDSTVPVQNGSTPAPASPATALSEVPTNSARNASTHLTGAVDSDLPAAVNGTKMDVGQQPLPDRTKHIDSQQPGPQVEQVRARQAERREAVKTETELANGDTQQGGALSEKGMSGGETVGGSGLSLDEERRVEGMLRERYASASIGG